MLSRKRISNQFKSKKFNTVQVYKFQIGFKTPLRLLSSFEKTGFFIGYQNKL